MSLTKIKTLRSLREMKRRKTPTIKKPLKKRALRSRMKVRRKKKINLR
jgi:hypothetical protein